MARLEDNTWHFWWELAYCSDAGGQPGHALMWQASTLRQAWGGKLPEFRWLPALQLIMAGFGMEAFHVLHHGRGERRAAIGRISTLALLLCSVVLIQRPQTTQTTRVKIVALLRCMVDTVASLDISAEFHIPVGGAVVTLRLLRSGELDGLDGVLRHMPAIEALWQAHAGRGPFRGECGGAFRLSVPSAALCLDVFGPLSIALPRSNTVVGRRRAALAHSVGSRSCCRVRSSDVATTGSGGCRSDAACHQTPWKVEAAVDRQPRYRTGSARLAWWSSARYD